MRTRLALLLALALAVPVVCFPAVSAQASGRIVIAQEETEEPAEGEEGTGGEESGGEGEEAGSAEEETGPVWTYQMARIGLVMLVLLLLGVAGAYRNFVHKRAKEGI